MKSGRSDREAAVEIADGEIRMRQWRKMEKETETRKYTHTNERERKSERDEDPSGGNAAERVCRRRQKRVREPNDHG